MVARQRSRILVGTAGWRIPTTAAPCFTGSGSHLQRYARVLTAVEINSSFYRSHRLATYLRWAAATPRQFRFSLKVPRAITHDARLCGAREPLQRFLDETAGLGPKRGPLLVQLPPSLAFEPGVAARFFDCFRARHAGTIVCEPRHATWFTDAANDLLVRHHIGRVAADPEPAAGAGVPAGWAGVVYLRLHGSPRMYWSRYGDAYIATLEKTLPAFPDAAQVWCVFDNTARGAAFDNACDLQTRLGQR